MRVRPDTRILRRDPTPSLYSRGLDHDEAGTSESILTEVHKVEI